jgi:hypothetical protein
MVVDPGNSAAASFTIANDVITNNTCAGGKAGAGADVPDIATGGTGGNGGTAGGGAIALTPEYVANFTINITATSIISNKATGGDAGAGGTGKNGGTGGKAGAAFGGGILLAASPPFGTGTVNINSSAVGNNSALSGDGGKGGAGLAGNGGDGGDGADSLGGGIYVQFGGTLNLLHATVNTNVAIPSGAGDGGNGPTGIGKPGTPGTGIGGGVYIATAVAVTATSDTAIINNLAAESADVFGTIIIKPST